MKLDLIKIEYRANCMDLLSREVLKDIIRKYLEYIFPNVTSCTSAVIDTKIEQAMDIVKNHLMYTMREEVEVLKERIVVLLERIQQLEIENDFLKSHASPEVLRALNNGAAAYKQLEYDDDLKKEDLEVATIIENASRQNRI